MANYNAQVTRTGTGSAQLPGPLRPIMPVVPIYILAGPFARTWLQRLIERLGPGAEPFPTKDFAWPHAVVHQHPIRRHVLRLMVG
jgi:hypothetical protein